ncbi:hypothetical protein GGI07_002852 [Coemansia sp. Benny D115]|nr:hypothetical protein GGI07_002852 [Coemansia sp. Benny D115]
MGGMPCSHLPLTPDSLFSGDEEAAIASPPSPRYSRSESKAGDVDMPLQKQQRRLATPPPAPPPLPPESGAAAAAAAAVEEDTLLGRKEFAVVEGAFAAAYADVAAAAAAVEEDACLQPSSALLPKRHSGEAMAAQRPIVSSGSLDAAALPLTISTSYLAVGGGLLGLSRALGTPSAADAIEAAGEQTHYHRHQQQICVAIVSESNQESEWGDSAVCNPMPMCAQHVEASGLAENPGDEHTPIYVSSENEQGSRRVVGGGGAIEGVSLLQGHAGGSAKIEIGLSDIFAAYPTKSKASSLNVHNARVFDNVLDTLNIGAIRPIPH